MQQILTKTTPAIFKCSLPLETSCDSKGKFEGSTYINGKITVNSSSKQIETY